MALKFYRVRIHAIGYEDLTGVIPAKSKAQAMSLARTRGVELWCAENALDTSSKELAFVEISKPYAFGTPDSYRLLT